MNPSNMQREILPGGRASPLWHGPDVTACCEHSVQGHAPPPSPMTMSKSADRGLIWYHFVTQLRSYTNIAVVIADRASAAALPEEGSVTCIPCERLLRRALPAKWEQRDTQRRWRGERHLAHHLEQTDCLWTQNNRIMVSRGFYVVAFTALRPCTGMRSAGYFVAQGHAARAHHVVLWMDLDDATRSSM